MSNTHKTCSRCKTVRPIDQFSRYKRTSDGRQSYCKPCMKQYQGTPRAPKTTIKYAAAHRRVLVARGRAAELRCIDCDSRADHWSYNHASPSELRGLERRGGIEVAYSPDPDDYDPRCVPCHKRFDLGQVAA